MKNIFWTNMCMKENNSPERQDTLSYHTYLMGRSSRLEFVDIAKAFLIMLVVVGHFNPTTSNNVWDGVVKVIYSFHMPAFMFLSGLLFTYTQKSGSYSAFVWRKAKRLMIPYLTASTCIISVKLVMQCVVEVKNEVEWSTFIRMFWYPEAAYHLWFVWVLMLMFLVVGVSSRKWYRALVGLLAVVLWLVPIHLPSAFCLSHVKNMAVFFMAGLWMQDGGWVTAMQDRWNGPTAWRWMWTAELTLCFVLMECWLLNGSDGFWVRRVLPFVGIGSVCLLSLVISDMKEQRIHGWLSFVGSMSFVIYLFHTCFSEFAKVVLARMGITAASDFTLCMFLVSLAGFSFPLLLGKWVVSRSEVLSFLLGQPFSKKANIHGY